MHDREKSDRLVLPAKLPNSPAQAGAEMVEGRGLPEGNTAGEPRPGLGAGLGVSSDLDRVRRVARKDRDVRFTALLRGRSYPSAPCRTVVDRMDIANRPETSGPRHSRSRWLSAGAQIDAPTAVRAGLTLGIERDEGASGRFRTVARDRCPITHSAPD
jgi:hypothetical protein